MAIKWIGSNWKTDLKTGFPPADRFYIDFRQEVYPPLVGESLAFTFITSGDNQPGSHNLTAGQGDYILELKNKMSIYIKAKPTFNYDVATDQTLLSWYRDATHYLKIFYDATDDKIKAAWYDGTAERILESTAFESNAALQTWKEIVCVLDLTTGTTAGSALYLDGSSVDSVWSDNSDVMSSNFPIMSVLNLNGTAGDWDVNQIRLLLDKTVDSDNVDNLFKDIEEEEIVFHFNGVGVGHTRCNITRFVNSHSHSKSVENPMSGSQGANSLSLSLLSKSGEFADDQYAAFDPTLDQFNGTISQKYMCSRCGIEAETWYDGDFELYFTGRLDSNLFTRRTEIGDVSRVDISAEDGISDIAREVKRKTRTYEDKKLSDATEADSLVHLITRLATQKEVYNFAANSSFENTTIANSWVVGGSGAAISRVSGGLFGSYQCDLVYGSAACSVWQYVTFAGTKKLNVGETWNFSIYLKSASACGDTIILGEYDSSGINDSSSSAWSLSGGEGWKKFEVSHTITDETSDRLLSRVYLDDNVTLSIDGAMLIQNKRALNFFVLNNNDGSSGTESADDADSASYDMIGFDVDAVNITHPWVMLMAGSSIWENLKEIADAVGCTYIGMDACGTLKLRAKLKTGYTDPTSIETITSVGNIAAQIEPQQANKIMIHGCKILKETDIGLTWMARAAMTFTKKYGISCVAIANGGFFPDVDEYGDFWAKYGDIKRSREVLDEVKR